MKEDKPYGDIRHEAKIAYMKEINAMEYAREKLLNMIDEVDEINNNITHLKSIIKEYFSDNLQMNETPTGAMRRNQIRKELLEFALK